MDAETNMETKSMPRFGKATKLQTAILERLDGRDDFGSEKHFLSMIGLRRGIVVGVPFVWIRPRVREQFSELVRGDLITSYEGMAGDPDMLFHSNPRGEIALKRIRDAEDGFPSAASSIPV